LFAPIPVPRPAFPATALTAEGPPLSFEANVGQGQAGFDFLARAAGYGVGLGPTEAALAVAPPSASPLAAAQLTDTPDGSGRLRPDGRPFAATKGPAETPAVVRMQLVNGNPAARAERLDQLPGKVNYFIGNDPARWHTNIPTFARVGYQGVYPGIDLVYRGSGGQLEYDFLVAPGADPGRIGLRFAGADALSLDARGDLVIEAAGTQVVQHRPAVYQDISGVRQGVAAAFRLDPGTRLVTFDLGVYDASRPLVIDPQVVSYSTYLGGPGYDYGYGVAVDGSGSAYVTGEAGSSFPLVNPEQQYAGGKDAFVSKFSPDGSTLLYSTYVGGIHEESADAIAVDFKGAAYITGYTLSGDFPTTPGAFQPLNGDGTCNDNTDCSDAFVTKLSPDGAALLYSTYLGTNYTESGEGIAVDAAGSAYVFGQTNGKTFYTLNAAQPTFGGGSCTHDISTYPCFDAFITKFNPAGTGLVYSTYLGGNRDEAYFFHFTGDITVDPAGYAYVTGYTESYNFPLKNALQTVKGPARSGYVTKLSPDGSAFVYSTYLGGYQWGGRGTGIAADSSGSAYVTGRSGGDFPTTPGAFQAVPPGDAEGFVSKLPPDGAALLYSTFLGGTKADEAKAIAVDAAGSAYVTGWTYSKDFPTQSAFQPAFGGGEDDAFVTKLNPAGSNVVYSSYLGGGGNLTISEAGLALDVDPLGNAFVAGGTESTDFPTVRPFQAQSGGNNDAFLSKVSRFARAPLQL
jgi:hypothetical protein